MDAETTQVSEEEDDSDEDEDSEDETAELADRELENRRSERKKRKKETGGGEGTTGGGEEEVGIEIRQPPAGEGRERGQLQRKWYDEVVFENQAKDEPQRKKRSSTTPCRTFHKKFLSKYIQ